MGILKHHKQGCSNDFVLGLLMLKDIIFASLQLALVHLSMFVVV